jgi:hypothetical protein
VTLGALASACSTTNAQDDGGTPPVDAASGPQPLGQPCDPSIATPCLPTEDDCLTVTCDPTTHLCAQATAADAGPTCAGGAAPCTKDSDCDEGLTCGFPLGGGCGPEGATGVCLDLPVLCESIDDGGACSPGGTACGCGGLPVPIVFTGYAVAPTSSASAACADSGGLPEAGAADGATDAGGEQ